MEVPDLAFAWDPAAGVADIVVEGNDLKLHDGLETGMLLSLVCHARAQNGDDIPDGTGNRRGWWADEFAENRGDKIGSRLWLLDRSKRTPDVRKRVQEYAEECWAWLVADKVASRVEVDASLDTIDRGWVIAAQVFRPPPGSPDALRFLLNWAGQFSVLR